MTRFALAGKFGNPGNPGWLDALGFWDAAVTARGRSPASAMPPRPQAVFAKKWRRVISKGEFPLKFAKCILNGWFGSFIKFFQMSSSSVFSLSVYHHGFILPRPTP